MYYLTEILSNGLPSWIRSAVFFFLFLAVCSNLRWVPVGFERILKHLFYSYPSFCIFYLIKVPFITIIVF